MLQILLALSGAGFKEKSRRFNAEKNFNYGPLGGFSTFNFAAEYRQSKNVFLNFNITNIFNSRQIEFVGSPSIGRLAMVSIKVND